jgi:hypothetical protein
MNSADVVKSISLTFVALVSRHGGALFEVCRGCVSKLGCVLQLGAAFTGRTGTPPFCAVVQSNCRFDEHVLHVRKLRDLSFCSRIAAQLIGDDLARHRVRTVYA